MKEIALQMIQKMVDEPGLVEIEEITDIDKIVLIVKTGSKDAGKVIGKQGRNINALRILMRAICAKNLPEESYDRNG